MRYDVKRLKTWQKIGISCLVFVIAGLVGWLFEYILTCIHKGNINFYWQGGNFLPWINMYSIGAFIIFFCTYKYRKEPIKVLLISLFSTGIFEYFTGLILDKGFGKRYWNYDNQILNIQGYTCILSLTAFALGGLLLMYVIIPRLIKLARKSKKKLFLTVSIVLFAVVLSDEIYNFLFTKMFNLPSAIEIYKNIKF